MTYLSVSSWLCSNRARRPVIRTRMETSYLVGFAVSRDWSIALTSPKRRGNCLVIRLAVETVSSPVRMITRQGVSSLAKLQAHCRFVVPAQCWQAGGRGRLIFGLSIRGRCCRSWPNAVQSMGMQSIHRWKASSEVSASQIRLI